MKNTVRIAAPFIAPLALFLSAFYLLTRLDTLSPLLKELIHYGSYILFTITAILSWRFNRSRVFYTVLLLATAQFALTGGLQAAAGWKPAQQVILAAVGVLLPVNLLLLAFLKERGIFTLWGAIKSGIFLTQIGTVFHLLNTGNNKLLALFQLKLLPVDFTLFHSASQPALGMFLICFAILLIRFILNNSYLEAAFIGVLAALFIAFYLLPGNKALPVFFAASGFMLILSLLQETYSMAFLDELTGLPSRRALRHELMKLSGKYTIAMLDIDFFKKFNDTYGHDVGDQVLKMVAGSIRNVSGGGKFFRYGGEEFTVLFPGKGLGDAIPHLEELREAVSKRGFTQRAKDRPKRKPRKVRGKTGAGKQLFVTISIGAAEKNDRHKNPEEVIKAADSALYRAKKKGRNCVSK